MKPIRTGVVGVGHLGYHHTRIYRALDGSVLTGVVDSDRERAARVASEFGTEAYPDTAALIAAGVDAVSVVVPTTAHEAVAAPLLEAGADVLVEKPIALDAGQARRLVDIAAGRGRIFQVGHVERFNGAFVALARAIERPRFIECHRLSPFTSRGDDVSVVLDLMIHDLDILRALDGSPVVSLDAVGVPVFSGQEDIANVRIRFASGCVANVTSSRISVDRMRKIRVFSEDCYASTDYTEQQVLVYRRKPGPPAAGASPMELISVESLAVEREEPLKAELSSFLDCVRTRNRPRVNGEDGLAALELALRVRQFIREHA